MKTNMYQVVELPSKSVVATGFAKREDAKPARNTFISGAKAARNSNVFIVARGSDHPRGPSFGPVIQSKRWL